MTSFLTTTKNFSIPMTAMIVDTMSKEPSIRTMKIRDLKKTTIIIMARDKVIPKAMERA